MCLPISFYISQQQIPFDLLHRRVLSHLAQQLSARVTARSPIPAAGGTPCLHGRVEQGLGSGS